MTRSPSSRVAAYAAVGSAALIVGLATSTPAATVAGAAVFSFLVFALGGPPLELPRCRCRLSASRIGEGESVTMTLILESERPLPWLSVDVELPAALELENGSPSQTLALAAGESRTIELPLEARRWGAFGLGEVELTGRDRCGLLIARTRVDAEHRLRVYPRIERLRRLLPLPGTLPTSGLNVGRMTGEGIEFAEIRPFAAGDRVRRVNWRASTRANTLLVNDTHPERVGDVCLLLDSFTPLAAGGDEGTLEAGVRVAAALVRGYLRTRNRVGLVGFGDRLRWVVPSTGLRQLYQIVEAMLETEASRMFVWQRVDAIPRRIIPPRALVVAVTPLLDERTTQALFDLRARHHQVFVIEVDPEPAARQLRPRVDDTAFRLWSMSRDALRSQYLKLGMPLLRVDPSGEIGSAVEEVSRRRQRVHARHG